MVIIVYVIRLVNGCQVLSTYLDYFVIQMLLRHSLLTGNKANMKLMLAALTAQAKSESVQPYASLTFICFARSVYWIWFISWQCKQIALHFCSSQLQQVTEKTMVKVQTSICPWNGWETVPHQILQHVPELLLGYCVHTPVQLFF